MARGKDFPRQAVDRAALIDKARITRPTGSDGVIAFGGWLSSGESNSALSGSRKWLTYANAINEAVVATGVRYFGNLLAGTKWSTVPNQAGGKDAERGADIVRQGMIEAPMPKRWPMVVRKAAMYRMLGYSLHACGMGRRPDGMVVFTAIEHRPQHTIQRWLRSSPMEPWEAVEQRTSDGQTCEIPLEECLYCLDDTLTDSPEGVGLLRHVIELVRRLGVYQGLEGLGHQSNLGGMPVGRAPLSDLKKQAEGLSLQGAEINAYVQTATAFLTSAMEKRNKTPEQLQYLLLDSLTYQGRDPNTISSTYKWALDIIRGDIGGLAEINTVITRIQLEIARVLGIEFAMVGGGDTAGTFGMHQDKTSMFATNLAVTLDEVAAFAEPLARRLVRANGLDPDTCTPKLVVEPISTDAIETVTRSLANLSMAGLRPDDEARNVIRDRLRLPPEPDPSEDAMAPRARLPFGPRDPDPTKEPELDDVEEPEIEEPAA